MTQIKNNSTQNVNSLVNQKLIVISRRDIIPGYQLTQSVHSSHQFLFEHPELSKDWFLNSNYLVILSVENEKELIDIINKLYQLGITFSKFHEPDLNNELTSISFLSSNVTKKITGGMSLLLKEFNTNKEG